MTGHTKHITLAHVRSALQQPRPGLAAQARMLPLRLKGNEAPPNSSRGQQAGVLVLVYPVDAAPHFVLTRRTETVQNHKGQISLPGGAREGDESLTLTALREAHEELGIITGGLEILGTLTPLYVGVSDYLITPVVAVAPQRPQFHPDPIEVAEVIEAPLGVLLDPNARIEEDWEIRGYTVHVPFFKIGSHKVWGATAMMLAEFAALLESTLTLG
jgi:8-oxo-dGTP pyrophosphatase MutT (NUDIX family)